MSIEENKTLAHRIYNELWNHGNLATARAIFSRPEGVEKAVREFRLAFPDIHHTVEEMIAAGDQVVIRFRAEGTHLGRWEQLPATGKPIHYTGVTILRIENGKIRDHHTWWDRWELAQQING